MRKYQVLQFLMLIQLKKTDSLRNSDEAAWNLAISEVNLCRGSKNSFCKTFLKILWNLQIKTCSRVCFLKHSATLKEDSGTSVFLWILKFVCIMPSGHCFCSLKNHSEILKKSLQNLPTECCYNILKTPPKKFVLVKFQTCIGNWHF